MKKTRIIDYIIPAYLAIFLLLQTKITITSTITILSPLVIVFLAVYKKNKNIGIFGISLFYIFSTQQIIISTIEDTSTILFYGILLVTPSILLLSQILQLDNPKTVFLSKENKKPLSIAIILIVLISAATYLTTIFYSQGMLLSFEATQGQIILITAFSLIFCTPLLIK